MLIGSRQRLCTFHNPLSLMIDGAPVAQVSSTKSLGVHIDQNLSWNVHIENLCKKISSGIGALKRMRSSFLFHTRLSDQSSASLDYCNSVWGSCSKTLANKLQKLQNRTARILTHSMMPTSWLDKTSNSQRSIHKAVIIYKSLNGLAPITLVLNFLTAVVSVITP